MLAEKPWKPETVLLLGAGVAFSLATGMLALSALGRFLPDLSAVQKNFLGFVVGVLFFQGASLVMIGFFLRHHETSWREGFGFAESGLKRVLAFGALAALIVVPASFLLGKVSELLLVAVGMKPEMQPSVKMLLGEMELHRILTYGIGAIVLAPVAEEMLFRGILYPTLKQIGRPRLALWFSAVVFAGSHVNLMAFIPLTFLALVLMWLYEKTGNLLTPILTHVLFNAFNFTLLVLQPSWIKTP